MNDTEVLICGAGPVGLTLACEVALQGVEVTVVERRQERSQESRALGIHARTLDLLDMRGLACEFHRHGHGVHGVGLEFVGGKSGRIDLSRIRSANPQMLILPQSETERILEERARDLGVAIVRGTNVETVAAIDNGVALGAQSQAGPRQFEGRWLVGCDGAHSQVRKHLQTSFEGSPYPYTIAVADAKLRRPPEDDLSIFVGPTGVVVCTAFGGGRYRVATVEHGQPSSGQDDVPMVEISQGLERIIGTDLGPYDPIWTSRFIIEERRAEKFRRGHVFLAGDSAHVHSPLGGQGLNLGVQDAFNLGWKLAYAQRGWMDAARLDSYETERGTRANHVIGATDKVTRLAMARPRLVQRLRGQLAPRILSTSLTTALVAEALSGVSTRYADKSKTQPWSGKALPNCSLWHPSGAQSNLFDHTTSGKYILINAPTRFYSVSHPRVAHVRAQAFGRLAVTELPTLIRPDGHVEAQGESAIATALAELH